jgi:hypothetical protein
MLHHGFIHKFYLLIYGGLIIIMHRQQIYLYKIGNLSLVLANNLEITLSCLFEPSKNIIGALRKNVPSKTRLFSLLGEIY